MAANKKTTNPKNNQTNQPKQTKQGKINALLNRKEGATLIELMEATEWKSHSVRGHLSNMRRKKKVNIQTIFNSEGKRCYLIPQTEEAKTLTLPSKPQ